MKSVRENSQPAAAKLQAKPARARPDPRLGPLPSPKETEAALGARVEGGLPSGAADGAGEAWAYEIAHRNSADLTPVVATNLRRLRVQRGLSLERLARASGVSRAMLGQIELSQSTPTINVLWKIATALDVPFAALISDRHGGGTLVMAADKAKILTSHDGRFSSRALFPFDMPRRVEFYELKLAAQATEKADAHPPGTLENLVVTQGALEIDAEGRTQALATGDAILFEADVAHVYRNPGSVDAVMYLVMTYTDAVG